MTVQTYDKLKKKWQLERSARRRRAKERKTALLMKGIPLFKKFGIQRVVLFGSVANSRSEKMSDIDLLVMPLSADAYWTCRHELEQALAYPVDLYTQDDDETFVNKMLQRGEVIYEIQS